MLKSLKFRNFKSWESMEMPLAPITGIFGTNSSGKTSILQFLLLLKQTKDATDKATALELNGDLASLGTIEDAIHLHNLERSISWSIAIELKEELGLQDSSGKRRTQIASSRNLTTSSEVEAHQQVPRSTLLQYLFGDMKFTLKTSSEKSKFALTSEGGDFRFERSVGRAWPLPGPIRSYAFPDQARTYFTNASFLATLEGAYEKALDEVYYLAPLREFPQRDYLWARTKPSDVGKRGQKTIDAILAATEARETRNLARKKRGMPFQEMIAHWLKELGLIYSFSVEEIAKGSNRWQARVVSRAGAPTVLLTDVGFGVSQVLPVITLLQYVPEGSTVVLEQPEIHLHPLAQANLADAIIQAALHRQVQVIFESHSEHLLLRLQRRIAEEVIGSESVNLYFCGAENGASRLERLEVDMLGNILNWPPKFMGDAFGEVASAQVARLERVGAKVK